MALKFDNTGVANTASISFSWTPKTTGFPTSYNGVVNVSGIVGGTVIDADWHTWQFEQIAYVMDQGGKTPTINGDGHGGPGDLYNGILGVIKTQLGAIPSSEGITFIDKNFEIAVGTTRLADMAAPDINVDTDRLIIGDVDGAMNNDGTNRVVQQMSIRELFQAATNAGLIAGAVVSNGPSFALGNVINISVDHGATATGHKPSAKAHDGVAIPAGNYALGGANAADFSLIGGELKLNTPADHKTKSSYGVEIIVTDAKTNTTATQNVTIDVKTEWI